MAPHCLKALGQGMYSPPGTAQGSLWPKYACSVGMLEEREMHLSGFLEYSALEVECTLRVRWRMSQDGSGGARV